MSGRLVDSRRHAAFSLGFLGRSLSRHHDARPFKDDPDEIVYLVEGLDGAAFVLLADDPVNYASWRLLGRVVRRLEVLNRRALGGDGRLEAWSAVGDELAELTKTLSG
jgi:hypothetical protein